MFTTTTVFEFGQ